MKITSSFLLGILLFSFEINLQAQTYCPPSSHPNLHIVQKGETLFGISKKYRVSVRQIKVWNNLTSDDIYPCDELFFEENIPESFNEEQERFALKGEATSQINRRLDFHIVKKDETLFGIARQYKMTVQELKSLNELENDLITPAQKLKVLITWNYQGHENSILEFPVTAMKGDNFEKMEKRAYVVKEDDTLHGIARNFSTSVDQLQFLNNKSDASLKIGELIWVPRIELVNVNAFLESPMIPKISDKPDFDCFGEDDTEGTHILRPGETLQMVAQKYNISLSKLREWNSLENKSFVQDCSRLYVINPRPNKEVILSDYPIFEDDIPATNKFYPLNNSDYFDGNTSFSEFNYRIQEALRFSGFNTPKRKYYKMKDNSGFLIVTMPEAIFKTGIPRIDRWNLGIGPREDDWFPLRHLVIRRSGYFRYFIIALSSKMIQAKGERKTPVESIVAVFEKGADDMPQEFIYAEVEDVKCKVYVYEYYGKEKDNENDKLANRIRIPKVTAKNHLDQINFLNNLKRFYASKND